MQRIKFVAPAVAVLLALPLLAQDRPKNSNIENIGRRDVTGGAVNFYSFDREIALGRQLAAEIERQVKLIDDPTINEYVNRIGQTIVLNSDARNLPITFRVVESDELGGQALPGGFIFIN